MLIDCPLLLVAFVTVSGLDEIPLLSFTDTLNMNHFQKL